MSDKMNDLCCPNYEAEYERLMDRITCSCCKEYFSTIDNCTEQFNFCPNCGCQMVGDKDGRD